MPRGLYLSLVVPCLLAFLLVACGGSGDGNSGGMGELNPPRDNVNGSSSAPSTGSGSGFVVVQGETHPAAAIRRCEPFGDEGDLDLTAQAGPVRIFVYVTSITEGTDLHELSLQGDMGVFGNAAFEVGDSWIDDQRNEIPGPPFNVNDTRIRGALTVYSATDSPDSVDVEFDLPIPSRIDDC